MRAPLSGSSKKFKLDHSYDDHTYDFESKHGDKDSISTISGGSKPPPYAADPSLILETPEERRSRKRSHWVAYATVCVMTVGFSCVLSGVWPYLHSLDKSRSLDALGWVVGANPLGQLIFSPIVGYLGNRLGKIRYVCYVTVVFFVIGNVIYALLPYMDFSENSVYIIMICSRFLVGISSSNITLCRSYLASSTTVEERTKRISYVSAAQSLGFVLGPVAQTIFTVAFPEGTTQYEATGWFAASIGIINFIILTPYIFQEYDIASKERQILQQQRGEAEEEFTLPKTDYPAVVAILYCFFMNMFVYVLLETLMEPFVQDQYAWCDNAAVIVVGVSFCAAGVISLGMFILAVRLAKKYDERKILLFGAFIPIAIGVFLFIPWGPETITCDGCHDGTPFPSVTNGPSSNLELVSPITPEKSLPQNFNYIIGLTYLASSSDDDKYCDPGECKGCPCDEQPWCEGYNKLPLPQFYVAFLIVISGYPYGTAMSNSIFSKILGPIPQGTWMGVLTSSGSLARVLGPVFVSYLYSSQGTIPTFSAILGGMLIAIVVILLMFRRLVPMKIDKKGDENRI
ncbi:Major facilitator superfamily domain-containing protein 8 [Armadillidium nasatum]|uniref:Major facilitator superfamily domain-containing protein 8 n=1 Tax=Armadillidium nasatum TaxID=96803 RepID=A0A5N5T3C0_9CRUS|nr:Major facilitator superfamily domain-containing protein 8 [Armadillidium nasatum]